MECFACGLVADHWSYGIDYGPSPQVWGKSEEQKNEKGLVKVTCVLCGSVVSRTNMPQHKRKIGRASCREECRL